MFVDMEFCLLYLWFPMSGFLEHITATCALGGLGWTFFCCAAGKTLEDAPDIRCFIGDYKNSPSESSVFLSCCSWYTSRKASCLKHFQFHKKISWVCCTPRRYNTRVHPSHSSMHQYG